MLSIVLAGATSVATFSAGLLSKAGPPWSDAMNATHSLHEVGWQGAFVTAVLADVVVMGFCYGALAKKAAEILSQRLFPD